MPRQNTSIETIERREHVLRPLVKLFEKHVTTQRAQIMELSFVQFSPPFCSAIYSLQADMQPFEIDNNISKWLCFVSWTGA
jgi:hypothetical protein